MQEKNFIQEQNEGAVDKFGAGQIRSRKKIKRSVGGFIESLNLGAESTIILTNVISHIIKSGREPFLFTKSFNNAIRELRYSKNYILKVLKNSLSSLSFETVDKINDFFKFYIFEEQTVDPLNFIAQVSCRFIMVKMHECSETLFSKLNAISVCVIRNGFFCA